ncbi:MAG: BamA/TamA family outer membrane protein [Chitinophagaceae bacterium]
MIDLRQVTISFFSSLTWVMLVFVMMAVSCTVPKKYQADKPFVFKTDIKVEGSIKGAERQDLEIRLANQLDDSLKTRVIAFGGIRKTLVRPAVFDTSYANNSMHFMNALLYSLGYYQAQIHWDSTLKKIGKQLRVTIDFTVNIGKNLTMDSVGFALTDSALQALTLRSRRTSKLIKGESYAQQKISEELDRLIELYKNNGYYKIIKEDIYAEVDTVFAGLINPGLDPFEQARLLNELQQKRLNPTIKVIIKQRTKEGTDHLKKYRIGNVSIYPDQQLFEDTTKRQYDSITIKKISIFSRENKFKPGFLARNSSLLPDSLYRQRDYYKTINTFSQLGAWQQVNVDLYPNDSLGLLNANINLYPARKLSLLIDLEATRNSGDAIITSNLFGVGLNFGLRNNNLAKESIQATSNIRGGIEFGTKTRLIQTYQGSFIQNIYFPKFILPFKIRREDDFNSSRTILNFNASYTDRRDFFTLGSINGSIGYEWTTRERRTENRSSLRKTTWLYIPFNLELVRLGARDSLKQLFVEVPNLANSFKNGLVISQNLIFQTLVSNKNKFNSLKIGLEESGAIFGLLKYVDREGGLFRYVKVDAEFKRLIRLEKSDWAFRGYAGVGITYGKTITETGQIVTENSLPFFKSFFAGGPNSMRAWQVRRLGIGSSIFYDTLGGGGYDRFADIQLEANVEFRFNVGTIAGIKLKSAFFSDIGNIWSRTTDGSVKQAGSEFDISRIYKDIAVAAGTSLRFDFDYFLIRFDWAYKVKNPYYANINDGWFQKIQLTSGQFQLGIGMPF